MAKIWCACLSEDFVLETATGKHQGQMVEPVVLGKGKAGVFGVCREQVHWDHWSVRGPMRFHCSDV